ncbi:DUF5602 domain-containing protein [Hymenobacter segetis]|uniref:DUF5602 domain-containing protein n=1 Tax=Hymenobacter segetis TaxID=2025509 RepID=A0ABU9LXD6_9BACT
MTTYPSLTLGGWCRAIALLALGMPLLLACSKDSDSPTQPATTYGTSVTIGTGAARSFVSADANGKPTEIGVAVNEAALASLPTTPATGIMYDMPLPANNATSQMPFDHISFDWNPNGHDPSPIYTLPHFDAHFYMQPMAAQHAITLDDPKGDIFPASNKLPAGYITAPNVAPARTIPMMGRHWVDPTSPEYTPGTAFTHTLIYGTYDGHVTFVEPMFTKAILVPAVSIERDIKQPAVYEVTGKFFPTKYVIRYNAESKEYIILLKDMVLH